MLLRVDKDNDATDVASAGYVFHYKITVMICDDLSSPSLMSNLYFGAEREGIYGNFGILVATLWLFHPWVWLLNDKTASSPLELDIKATMFCVLPIMATECLKRIILCLIYPFSGLQASLLLIL